MVRTRRSLWPVFQELATSRRGTPGGCTSAAALKQRRRSCLASSTTSSTAPSWCPSMGARWLRCTCRRRRCVARVVGRGAGALWNVGDALIAGLWKFVRWSRLLWRCCVEMHKPYQAVQCSVLTVTLRATVLAVSWLSTLHGVRTKRFSERAAVPRVVVGFVHVFVQSNVWFYFLQAFAFLELKTMELATAVLELDGIVFKEIQLKMRRPSDYNPSLVPAK